MPERVVTIASTTASQAELEHAASDNWRQPFVKLAETKEEPEPSNEGKTEAESETATTTEQQPGKGKGEGQHSNGWQKRVDRLTARNKSIETENATLRAELETFKQQRSEPAKPAPATKPAQDDGEPKLEDFQSPNEWLRAHNAWDQERQQRSTEESERQNSVRETWDAHNSRISEARAKYDDFDEVAKGMGDINIPQSATLAIIEAENSADVCYYLATHTDEAKKLAEMKPLQQIAAITRISDKIKADSSSSQQAAPKPKPQSQAPQPIKPVGGGSNSKSSVPLDKEDFQAYKRRRANGER